MQSVASDIQGFDVSNFVNFIFFEEGKNTKLKQTK